jgi:hypothetical protein
MPIWRLSRIETTSIGVLLTPTMTLPSAHGMTWLMPP